jgi:hypothetical protein
MREKQSKIKRMKTGEPVISLDILIRNLPTLTDLNQFLYGQYSNVNFPKYFISPDKTIQISENLIDNYLEIKDRIQYNSYKKIIISLLYFLTDGDFDIARYGQENASFKDSEINIRMTELCSVLALQPESKIKLIIEYLFDLKDISPDSNLRKQINIIVDVLHQGKVDDLSNSADLSIPFKADLLNYINLLNFPFNDETAKRFFFIKLLDSVYLEMSEGTFSLHNIHNPDDDPRKTFITSVKMHPFLKYHNYSNYVNDRYKLINQFLKTQNNNFI